MLVLPLQAIISICILLPASIAGFGMNLMKVPEEDRAQVVCTMALLQKYFRSGETLSGSVMSMSITSAPMHVQQSLLHAIHIEATLPWTVVVKNARQDIPLPAMILHEKPQCYFAIVENLEDEDLEDVFDDWKTTVNWNPVAQFVVYLSSVEETDEEMTELMVEILLSFMNKKIFNVNVIGQSEENGFFYGKTVFPYHPDNNCGNRVIAIETLDICNYQDEEDEEDDADYEDEEEDEDEDFDDEMDIDTEDGESDNSQQDSNEKEEGKDEISGESDNSQPDNNPQEDDRDNDESEEHKDEAPEDLDNSQEDNSESEHGKDEIPEESDISQQDNNESEDGKDEIPEESDNSQQDNESEDGKDEISEQSDNSQQDNNESEDGKDEIPEESVNSQQDNNESKDGKDEIPGESDNPQQDNNEPEDGKDKIPEESDNTHQGNNESEKNKDAISKESDNSQPDNDPPEEAKSNNESGEQKDEIPEDFDNNNESEDGKDEIPEESDNSQQDKNESEDGNDEIPEESDNSQQGNNESEDGKDEIPEESDNSQQDNNEPEENKEETSKESDYSSQPDNNPPGEDKNNNESKENENEIPEDNSQQDSKEPKEGKNDLEPDNMKSKDDTNSDMPDDSQPENTAQENDEDINNSKPENGNDGKIPNKSQEDNEVKDDQDTHIPDFSQTRDSGIDNDKNSDMPNGSMPENTDSKYGEDDKNIYMSTEYQREITEPEDEEGAEMPEDTDPETDKDAELPDNSQEGNNESEDDKEADEFKPKNADPEEGKNIETTGDAKPVNTEAEDDKDTGIRDDYQTEETEDTTDRKYINPHGAQSNEAEINESESSMEKPELENFQLGRSELEYESPPNKAGIKATKLPKRKRRIQKDVEKPYSERNYGLKRKTLKVKNSRIKTKNTIGRLKRDIDYDFDTNSTGDSAKVYLQELYRALFLDKFPRDLSGCPLMAAYRPWEPYIFNEANESEDEEEDNGETFDGSADDTDEQPETETKLNGIEYQMIQTIGELLHINIEMQIESNNLYHLFQQLIDGDIEMVVGGIDEDPSISQYVSSTVPYHQDDLTWCVAKAKRKHSLFNFLESFKVGTWALTFAFIFTSSLSIVLAQHYLRVQVTTFKSYFITAMRVYGILLSQSISLTRIPAALKISLGTTFFMGFMFSNVYQSFLVSTLTNPKSSYQISHLAEIHRHRMTVTGSVDNVRHLNKDGEIFKYIREKFQMCYNIEECLQRAATDEHIAVAVSRQHSFYNPRIPRDQLYCFDRDENLYVYLVTMLLPKKFHLLHKINPVIQHIIESGHMQKWARDLDRRRMIQEEIQRAREEPFKSLTLAQVHGSFVFTGMLLLAAASVLLLEVWVYWMTIRRRTRLKLVKMMHRKFR